MTDREAIAKLVAEILDGTELCLRIDKYSFQENLETREVTVEAEVHHERTGAQQVIEGKGVGIVDAFFCGLKDLYSEEFQSLRSIRFADFAVQADVKSGRDAAKSDMAARVVLHVANSENREFTFAHSSVSVTGSSIAVVVQAVEFFINSEQAFVTLYRALQHANENNRSDSVSRYTTQMATLVEATSYSAVIEDIKKKALES